MNPHTQRLLDWEEWLDEQSRAVRETARRFPPWYDVVVPKAGVSGRVHAFDEDEIGKVWITVIVELDFGSRLVHGLQPSDLVVVRTN